MTDRLLVPDLTTLALAHEALPDGDVLSGDAHGGSRPPSRPSAGWRWGSGR